MEGEPLEAEADPLQDATQYRWYSDGFLMETTYTPELFTYNWECGDHFLQVQAITPTGVTGMAYNEEYYWGLCSGTYAVAVYPNPTSSELTVSYADTEEAETENVFSAELYDAEGKFKKAGSSVNGRLMFDTNDLKDGLYIIHITTGSETIKRQVLVKR